MNAEALKLLISCLDDNSAKAEKHLAANSNAAEMIFEVGKTYFIRNIPYHVVGVCKQVVGNFVELTNSMWVADSGRFADALKDGFEKQTTSELEPITGRHWIHINATSDVIEYQPKLVVKQK